MYRDSLLSLLECFGIAILVFVIGGLILFIVKAVVRQIKHH